MNLALAFPESEPIANFDLREAQTECPARPRESRGATLQDTAHGRLTTRQLRTEAECTPGQWIDMA